MTEYTVQYLPLFYDMLRGIEDYMVDHGPSDDSIDRYRSGVFDVCELFDTFPKRGAAYDDIMQGLRTWNIDGHTVLAYVVCDFTLIVTFVGITCGGQDWMEIFSTCSSAVSTPPH